VSLLLEGKRAFITGGTRGIGAALCEVFAREGADVAFNYGSRDDLAAEIRQKIEALGRRAHSFKVSVIDRFGMKHLTRELVQAWGGIDILVNNAAINRGDNFATTTDRACRDQADLQADDPAAQRKDSEHYFDRSHARVADGSPLRNFQSRDDWVHQMSFKRGGNVRRQRERDCRGNLRYRPGAAAT